MSQFKTQTILDRDNYFCLPVNNLPACKLPVILSWISVKFYSFSTALCMSLHYSFLAFKQIFVVFIWRTREDSKTKAVQLQAEGHVKESWKMLARAAEIKYKHIKEFICVSFLYIHLYCGSLDEIVLSVSFILIF